MLCSMNRKSVVLEHVSPAAPVKFQNMCARTDLQADGLITFVSMGQEFGVLSRIF